MAWVKKALSGFSGAGFVVTILVDGREARGIASKAIRALKLKHFVYDSAAQLYRDTGRRNETPRYQKHGVSNAEVEALQAKLTELARAAGYESAYRAGVDMYAD